jgi:hypothetical protein
MLSMGLNAWAQGPILYNPLRTDTANSISLSLGTNYFSNNVKAGYLLQIFSRGVLLQDDLQKLANDPIDGYSIAYNDVIAFEYKHKFAGSRVITIGIERNDLLFTQLSHNLLSVIAYGNTPYKGDTLKVQGDRLFGLSTWEMKLGLSQMFAVGKSTLLAKAHISLIESNRFIDCSIGPSTLYTGPYGDRVELVYDLSYGIQKEGSPFSGMGLGAGACLVLFQPGLYSMGITLDQAGFLTFGNDRFIQAKPKGYLDFDGIFYPYPALSGFGSDSQHIDTFQHFKEQFTQASPKEGYRFGLPIQLGLSANMALGSKSSIHARFHYANQLTEKYVVNLAYAYALGPHWQAWVDLCKAEFSGTGLGMGAGYQGEKLAINLQLRGLLPLGTISPQGVHATCSYIF